MRPPTREELQELSALGVALMEQVLGAQVMEQLVATASDAGALLRARQTTLKAMENLFSSAPPIDEAAVERLVEPRIERFNSILNRSLVTNPMLRARAPRGLLQFLLKHRTHVDVARTEEIKFDGILSVLVPAEVVPSMVLNPENLFEPTINEAARFLCGSIEGWYKRLLTFLVDLTCEAHQLRRPRRLRDRSTLGEWIGAARDLWGQHSGPHLILANDLLELRNFITHEELQLDVVAETVVSPLDASKLLDRRRFARLVQACYIKLAAMWLAVLAAKYADERRASAPALPASDVRR